MRKESKKSHSSQTSRKDVLPELSMAPGLVALSLGNCNCRSPQEQQMADGP